MAIAALFGANAQEYQ
nr:hypothetical protein [Mycobacterium tuberculosis]